ncbi:MAG: hypothetical protein ACYDHZ_05710 [Dehalococcoidia bacterium]
MESRNMHKYRFTTTSAIYQAIILVLTFILGWISTVFIRHLGIIYNNSITSSNNPICNLDWCKGWNALPANQVQPMAVIFEGLLVFALGISLLLIAYIGNRNQDKKEDARQERLEKQLDCIQTSVAPKTKMFLEIGKLKIGIELNDTEGKTKKTSQDGD